MNILKSIPQSSSHFLRRLQWVQNAATRLVGSVSRFHHTFPALFCLHWLWLHPRSCSRYWCLLTNVHSLRPCHLLEHAALSGHAKGRQKFFGKKQGFLGSGTKSLELGAMPGPLPPEFQVATEDSSLSRSLLWQSILNLLTPVLLLGFAVPSVFNIWFVFFCFILCYFVVLLYTHHAE